MMDFYTPLIKVSGKHLIAETQSRLIVKKVLVGT